jgi:hypothetical protein
MFDRSIQIVALTTLLMLPACGTREIRRRPTVSMTRAKQKQLALEILEAPPVEQWDHWVRELNEFMTAEEIRQHLALPPGKRLLARNNRLMDLTLRKELLNSVRPQMTPKEIASFQQLPSYEDCRAMAETVQNRKKRR